MIYFLISLLFFFEHGQCSVQSSPMLKFVKHCQNFTISDVPFIEKTTHTFNECFATCVRERVRCWYVELAIANTNPAVTWTCRLFRMVLDLSANLIKSTSLKMATLYIVADKTPLSTVHCQTWRDLGRTTSGVYDLVLDNKKYSAYCEMTSDDKGWTLINRRIDGSTSFDHDWNQYKEGFGNKLREYWLGNDMIHNITTHNTNQQWLIKLEATKNDQKYKVIYKGFSIGSELSKYKLTSGVFESGDSEHTMDWLNHNNLPFTTSDMDNDQRGSKNCATLYKGNGWWHKSCFYINFNADTEYMLWKSIARFDSMDTASMGIRPYS